MTSLAQRQTLLSLIDEAVAAGARAARACQIVGLSLRTVQRWKLTPGRGDYLASESTMYRLLRSVGQLAHRGKLPGD